MPLVTGPEGGPAPDTPQPFPLPGLLFWVVRTSLQHVYTSWSSLSCGPTAWHLMGALQFNCILILTPQHQIYQMLVEDGKPRLPTPSSLGSCRFGGSPCLFPLGVGLFVRTAGRIQNKATCLDQFISGALTQEGVLSATTLNESQRHPTLLLSGKTKNWRSGDSAHFLNSLPGIPECCTNSALP